MRTATINIQENDDCTNPAGTLGGVVYMSMGGNLNDTYKYTTHAKAAELYPGTVKQADKTDWEHTIADYYVTPEQDPSLNSRALRSSTDYLTITRNHPIRDREAERKSIQNQRKERPIGRSLSSYPMIQTIEFSCSRRASDWTRNYPGC